MMVKRATGEATDFSQRVADEIDRAVGMSSTPTSEVIAAAGMSRNYYYKRLRGEMPFNTNDIGRIADALGIDPYELMRRAAAPRDNVTPLRPRDVRPAEEDERYVASPRDPEPTDEQ